MHKLPSMACFCPFSLQFLLLLLVVVPCSHAAAAEAAAAAAHHRARPPIKVQGIVLCDSCRENRLSNFSLPIPGATITLTCKNTLKHHSTRTPFTTKASSDKYGAFSFDLPFSKPRLMRRCKVELTSSPFEACIKQTSYSLKVLSPILSLKPQKKGHLAYFSGWLTFQPNFLPSFCTLRKEVLTKNGHNVDQSKDKTFLPQDFSFSDFFPSTPSFPFNFFPPMPTPFPGTSTPSFPFNFFPPMSTPFPGTSTPSFPFNFFPPMPTIPGTTTPTSPFNFPQIPGFPPFPEFAPFPTFPGLPSFPFFFPSPSPSLGPPNPFSTFPPFPVLEVPPNPFSPSTPTNPFSTPPNPFTSPPFQLPPNPFPPSTPTSPFTTPTNPFVSPPLQLPPLPPPWTSPPFLNP